MTDEVQTTELTPLSDLAVEVFGDEFHGISASERQETDQFAKRMRGYQDIAEQKSQEVIQPESDPATEPQWTTDELHALSTYQAEVQRFQGDYQRAVQAFNGIDINALEKTDKSRAVQIRVDAREWAQNLQQRYTVLEKVAQQIQEVAAVRSMSALRGNEMQKLIAAEPELANAAVRKQVNEYLLSQGFTQEELDSIFDSRAVIQAYRAMQAEKNPQPRKVPVFKRQPESQNDEVARARKRLRRTGSVDDALAVLTARNAQ